jgi:hypothetical protein
MSAELLVARPMLCSCFLCTMVCLNCPCLCFMLLHNHVFKCISNKCVLGLLADKSKQGNR